MAQERPIVDQGLTILCGAKDEAELDIVAIPGLGVEPKASWIYDAKPNSFNWLEDKEGISQRFPGARVMLYEYMSAWRSRYKVRQSFDGITMPLLKSLVENRKGHEDRPIIFICHSFGGLLLAKALCAAENDYPDILLCTAGCLFFGTPFQGAALARVGVLWETIRTQAFKNGNEDDYTDLLKLLEPRSEDMILLNGDIRSLIKRTQPEIPTWCIYETSPIDWREKIKKLAHWDPPAFVADGLSKLDRKRGQTCFVERESATLYKDKSSSRGCGHSDLVRFASQQEKEYITIIGVISKMAKDASGLVRNRYKLRKTYNEEECAKIRRELEVEPNMRFRRAQVSQTVTPHNFIVGDSNFVGWQGGNSKRCLWVVGPTGIGKTAVSLAAIRKLEDVIEKPSLEQPSLLSWYLCGIEADYCSAENLLKSILSQLLSWKPRLAIHASKFVKVSQAPLKAGEKPRDSKYKIPTSVDQLWLCLMEMVRDDTIKTAYIVINNLHLLDRDADSTKRFLQLLANDVIHSDEKDRYDRWFLTSSTSFWDDTTYFEHASQVQLMDLKDSKYRDVVQRAQDIYVNTRSITLAKKLGYEPGLAFEARDIMITKAENGKWMDIMGLRLEKFLSTERLEVLKCLDHAPADDVKSLVRDTWQSVFVGLDPEGIVRLKDILCTLVLVKDKIKVQDLCVLTGYTSDELCILLKHCYPLLQPRGISEEVEIYFADSELKTGLYEEWGRLLAQSDRMSSEAEVAKQKIRRHGLLALNCLSFFKRQVKAFKAKQAEIALQRKQAELEQAGETEQDELAYEDEEDSDEDDYYQEDDWEEDDDEDNDKDNKDDNNKAANRADPGNEGVAQDGPSDDQKPEAQECPFLSQWKYPVKQWTWHVEQGGDGVAKSICHDMADFWTSDSELRKHWLSAYAYNEGVHNIDSSMPPLHITAMLGLNNLAGALLGKNDPSNVNEKDQRGFTPLHYAAKYNRDDTLKLLLNRKATVNVPPKSTSPLHLAAFGGHVEIMEILIGPSYRANVNAISEEFGSVIYAAIRSGREGAVTLLLDNPDFVLPDACQVKGEPSKQEVGEGGKEKEAGNEEIPDHPALLSLAAVVSERCLLALLKYPDWTQDELYDALWSACDNDRQKSIEVLLEKGHFEDNGFLEDCMVTAAQQDFWEVVPIILRYGANRGLDCDDTFFLAATSELDQQAILSEIWQYTNYQIPQAVIDAALYQATDNEKFQTVQWLLKTCKANPNATSKRVDEINEDCYPQHNQDYGDALTAAAFDGNMEITKILLARGAKVDSPTGAALQIAAYQGHREIVELLLNSGANIDRVISVELIIQLDSGPSIATALQAACDSDHHDVAKLLLDMGADVNLGGGYFTFPIISAARRGNEILLGHLLSAKQKVNVNVRGGPDNSFALTNACVFMSQQCIEKLLDYGAEVNAADDDGDQAIHVAVLRGDAELVKLLLSKGAEFTRGSSHAKPPLLSAIELGYSDCARVIADAMVSASGGSNTVQLSYIKAAQQPAGENGAIQQIETNGTNSRTKDTDQVERQMADRCQTLQNENQQLTTRLQQIEQQFASLQEKYDSLRSQLDQPRAVAPPPEFNHDSHGLDTHEAPQVQSNQVRGIATENNWHAPLLSEGQYNASAHSEAFQPQPTLNYGQQRQEEHYNGQRNAVYGVEDHDSYSADHVGYNGVASHQENARAYTGEFTGEDQSTNYQNNNYQGNNYQGNSYQGNSYQGNNYQSHQGQWHNQNNANGEEGEDDDDDEGDNKGGDEDNDQGGEESDEEEDHENHNRFGHKWWNRRG